MLPAIVNHLWQSTLLVGAVAALAALLRDHGAHARYWLWWAASAKFLVPFSLLTLLGETVARPSYALGLLAEWPAALGVLAEPMPEAARSTPLAFALLGVWLLGAAAVAGTWAARAARVRALVRESSPYEPQLPLTHPLTVRVSRGVLEPALVGIVRPVLLLPHGIAGHLSPAQLGAVLEHELAHWRRRDNLTAVTHMLVEAVFWFHPLVWWVGARLVEERERACDEAVVRAGHDRREYAEAILNVCERYVASALKCAAGISGADLKRRVVEIARSEVMRDLPVSKRVLLGALALATLAVPIVFGAAGQGAGDRDLVPLVRIAPQYPPEALAARQEGAVTLEFTIDIGGRTKDIVVVDSTAPEFEAPAVAALTRWRYAPPVENGQPVERRGVRTMISYRLEDHRPDAEAR